MKHAYTDIYGKEKRKRISLKEGKLGLEGMPPQEILEALRRCGATMDDCPRRPGGEHNADFFAWAWPAVGQRSKAACRCCAPCPAGKNVARALLQAVNVLMTREELAAAVAALEQADAHRGDDKEPGGDLAEPLDDM